MAYLALLLTVASLTFWVYVLFDVIGSDSGAVRLLPKPAWAVVVLLLPKVGALLWFVFGRPRRGAVAAAVPPGPPPAFPEYEHPNRARGATPRDDEEFLRRCRERAEDQRRRARRAQEEREREARRSEPPGRHEGAENRWNEPEGHGDGPGGRGTDEDPQAPSAPVD
ncbi:hypothetical protein ADL05_21960 [Nocardiopsis sp. NRRL B-16309]|nr:PLD nuclease N-terminal domain-containing protein [Nocardiopsis sp. NRRL B-16309]KOX12178.1 hypothetical protein ADL05_21960 [Nocardiopsis sp. NRRL B-16309]